VVPTFELVGKIRKCDRSNHSYRAMITYPVILFGMPYNMILKLLSPLSKNEILCVTSQMKATEQYFLVVQFVL